MQLPQPGAQAAQVAATILEAAVSPTKDVRVGAMAKFNTTLAKLVLQPGEAMAKMEMGRQQRAEAPRSREGTLYRAGESGRIHGRGNANAADAAQAKAMNTRPAGEGG